MLIDASIADGEISEKERSVLHKRALAEGVDTDELDIVIDGRLAKLKNHDKSLENTSRLQSSNANRNQKYGTVRKCPNCGATVEAGSVKCKECAHHFIGVDANSSITKFSKLLTETENRNSGFGIINGLKTLYGVDNKTLRVISTINNFPIPTTKDDLLEFILFIEPKITEKSIDNSTPGNIKIADAYKKKYNECIKKAKLFFNNDPQFLQLFAQYENNKKFKWSNLSGRARFIIIYLIVFSIFILLVAYWVS